MDHADAAYVLHALGGLEKAGGMAWADWTQDTMTKKVFKRVKELKGMVIDSDAVNAHVVPPQRDTPLQKVIDTLSKFSKPFHKSLKLAVGLPTHATMEELAVRIKILSSMSTDNHSPWVVSSSAAAAADDDDPTVLEDAAAVDGDDDHTVLEVAAAAAGDDALEVAAAVPGDDDPAADDDAHEVASSTHSADADNTAKLTLKSIRRFNLSICTKIVCTTALEPDTAPSHKDILELMNSLESFYDMYGNPWVHTPAEAEVLAFTFTDWESMKQVVNFYGKYVQKQADGHTKEYLCKIFGIPDYEGKSRAEQSYMFARRLIVLKTIRENGVETIKSFAAAAAAAAANSSAAAAHDSSEDVPEHQEPIQEYSTARASAANPLDAALSMLPSDVWAAKSHDPAKKDQDTLPVKSDLDIWVQSDSPKKDYTMEDLLISGKTDTTDEDKRTHPDYFDTAVSR